MTASSMAFTNEYNIYSAGATSKNYFEGDINFDGTVSGTGDIYCGNLYVAGTTLSGLASATPTYMYYADANGDLTSTINMRYLSDGTFDINNYFGSGGSENYIAVSPTAGADWVGMGLADDNTYIFIAGNTGDIDIVTEEADADVLIGADNDVRFDAGGENQVTVSSGGIQVRHNISFTTSGTSNIGTAAIPAGNIYCDDLYTAGSSVHIGDTAVISETGSNKLNLDSDYFDIRVGGNSWLSNRDDYLYFGEDWGNDNSLFWQIDGSSGHGNFTLYSHTRTILSTQGTAPTNIITELKADTSEYIQINSNQTFMKLAVDGVKMTIGTNDVTFDTDILFGANTISGTGDIHGVHHGDGSNLTGISAGAPAVDDIGIEYDSQLELKDNTIILSYVTSGDGGTATAGAWYQRLLNTEVHDPNGWCSISSNRFTLVAGTYIIRARCEFYRTNSTQIRLRNYTDGVYWYGNSNYAAQGSNVGISLEVMGATTIAASKAFQIEYQTNTSRAGGNGFDTGFGDNTFTYVVITRVK
jgi:hypothetical protein